MLSERDGAYCLIGSIMAICRLGEEMALIREMNSTGETIFIESDAINSDRDHLETLMDSCFQRAVSKYWAV